MTSKEKKMAAALAAVSAYMQQEQEVYQEKLAAASLPPKPAWFMNIWGQSGRQAMAQTRNLMQLKAFNRFR
jgi:hypothetical protein